MKLNRKLKYDNNHYIYSINKEQLKSLKSSSYNIEVLYLWNSILKNDAIVDDIVLTCGLKRLPYSIIIEYGSNSDDIEPYEITTKTIPYILDSICKTIKSNTATLKNITKILKSLDSNYIMENLDTPIIDDISISKIINTFIKVPTKEEIINEFRISPKRLCDILEKQPLNLDSFNPIEKTIINRLDIPNESKINIFNNIMSFRYIHEQDYMSLSPIKTNESFIERFSLNENLKETILNEIPNTFTSTQKIYYIYRRLCQILTYDEKYYAGNQKRIYDIRHNSIDRISKIDEENNIVVCYESAVILACFCKELNIPFRILSYNMPANIRKYGEEHLNLEIKADEYIIKMDPTTGLINSDLAYEKSKCYVQSFYTINKIPRTIDKFDEELKTVDKYIELKSNELGYTQLLKKVKNLEQKQYKTETLKERLNKLINIILNNHLSKVDSLRYILDCYKAIFKEEYMNFAKIDFYSYYEKINDRLIPQVATVITYNEQEVSINKDENIYIIIINNQVNYFNYSEFQEVKLKFLMNRIDSDEEIIEENDEIILNLKK